MLEHAVYSILSPEGFASILYRMPLRRSKRHHMKLTSKDLLEYEIIDGIIPEPVGGAHNDKEMVIKNVKVLEEELKNLLTQPIDQLLENAIKNIERYFKGVTQIRRNSGTKNWIMRLT